MVSASEIKSRIVGVTETKKVTDAMFMISSAKMRRALRDWDETKPYFNALTDKIGELIRHIPETDSRYFRVPPSDEEPHKNHGILLITSDKGLAGAYNQTAIETCEKYMARHPRTTLFILGEYGRQYFINKGVNFVEEFHYSVSKPRYSEARKICMDLLEYYDECKLDEINVIYTDYVGAKPGTCKKTTLLPLEQTKFRGNGSPHETEFVPSPDVVLNGIIPSYLTGYIYGSLVQSFCSEQQARMNAMKNASDNAEEMLKNLRLQYNKIRQAAITNEMIEITAGAKAQRSKRSKPLGED